ncbi:MAG: LeuA family protein [Spirochaetales bacterium]|jgi:isopropylmalate/homocitrate/citramalate synthase|nr:LeuA family protein [Spirochaetales bacterium]
MGTPWQTDKWFTSPWNFAGEVTKDFNFAKNIKFHDVSLRDGEQQAGLAFSKEQKITLAEKLVEIGIPRIEAGMPAVSPQDAQAITEIAKRFGKQVDVFAFSRCMKDDVKRAVDCGVKGIVIEIPASEHVVKYAYRWEYKKAIDLSIEATAFARESGLYTVFFPIDGTRTEINTFINLIQRVEKEGHMDALGVVDTFGGLAPSACGYLIRKIREHIKKPLEAHFHDDFGLGAANTIMALAAGAEVAHTTISGIGERAGNASYEDIALSLLTMYGVDTGLKYDKMYPLSKTLREMCGLRVRQNRGIIGDDISNIESGIVADWYVKAKDEAPLELSPYLYGLTGHPDVEVVLGKSSGLPSIDIFLEKIGKSCDNTELKQEMLAKVKEQSLKNGGLVSIAQFKDIVGKVLT